MTTLKCAIALGLAATLAACNGDPPAEQAEEAERSAKGEVLGGTISDDMLPLDRIRSRSPSAEASQAASEESAREEASPATAGEGGETAPDDDSERLPDDGAQEEQEEG